jgi:minor extracellular serine protease Vpr
LIEGGSMNTRRVLFPLGIVLILSLLAGSVLAGASAPNRDFTEARTAPAQSEYAIVTFKDPPAASYTGGIPGLERTKPLRGRFDPNSQASQAYRRHLENVHANFRSWLAREVPGAEVLRDYFYVLNGVAIRLNKASPGKLAQGPGVKEVDYSWLYQPTMDVSPGLINAPALWSALGGPGKAGEGIKVGIIDSGIDLTSPFLSDADYPDVPETDACSPFSKPGGANTSDKVIICRVYASGIAPGAAAPLQLLVFDHGTHVAGTVAGNFDTSGRVAGTTLTISGMSGVAPRALLADYNVFPGFGAGFVAFGGSAFSHDIAAALEDALLDGMDVVNMSLGGGVQGPHDFLAEAVNAAVDAGLVVAVAAGNSGPGDATVESPGSAAGALTAGASTNPHFVGIPVTLGSGGTFGAAVGDFNPFDPPVLNAEFALASPANGCTAISGVSGKVALIDRGACTFTTKVRNAQNAGAIGVLVVNNVAGDPIAMAHDGTSPFPTIPAAMVSKSDGAALKAAAGTTTISIDGTSPAEFITANADIIAGFSSRGPTPFTYLIKPDVTAPGVNVVSGVFNKEFAFFQGTSMATPHVAGSAALLRQLHPDWSPADIKSALVNTARRPVYDHISGLNPTGVLTRGGGRIDLEAASTTPLTFDPASVSFGFWGGNKSVSADLPVLVNNVSGAPQTCSVSVSGPSIVSASTTSLSLAAGETTTFTLSLRAGKSSQTPSGDYSGDVEVTCGSTLLRLPWWVRIDRQAKP